MSNKKMKWYNIALMAFSSVWGFGNIVNGFSEYGGIKAIVAWIMIFAIYFVPYSLMVGEMGSAFKDQEGGVSSWIKETFNPKLAYYAGWTYWVVHIPYLSQKPQSILIAAMWLIFGNNYVSSVNPMVLQMLSLAIFLVGLWVASYGVNILKKISTIAGSSLFILSLLFVLMMLTAPMMTSGNTFQKVDLSFSNIMPKFDIPFFLNLSILVFAVGGCEKISPYVNELDKPAKNFPKSMIALAIMVAITAILGTIAMSMMFDSANIPDDLMTNGAYYAFQRLGEYYHLGNLFLVIYAAVNLIGTISAMIISIDAPLRMLLGGANKEFIPSSLFKQNKHGVFINGYKLIGVLTSILIIVPAMGISNVDALVKSIIKLNAVCMPLRYLWVFAAYIALKKAGDKFHSDYQFTKNKTLGIIMGVWCFAFTAFACLGGMIDVDNQFVTTLNFITPCILLGLGVVMPYLAKRERAKVNS